MADNETKKEDEKKVDITLDFIGNLIDSKLKEFKSTLDDLSLLNERLDILEELVTKTGEQIEEASPKPKKDNLPSFSIGNKIMQAKTFEFNVPSKEGVDKIDLRKMNATDLKAAAKKYPRMFKEVD